MKLIKFFFQKMPKILMFFNFDIKKIFFSKSVQSFNIFKFQNKKNFSKKRRNFNVFNLSLGGIFKQL
ncbi:MAG: hypothetical protein B6I24_08560 [Bacteroidetes bacterium 4572_128]|nr:MAG: hypothetical protein B6I24_08560 [Bacteroidetes bacterium 4572_128]